MAGNGGAMGKKERLVRIEVYVPESLKLRLQERAEQSDRSLSGLVTWTLRRAYCSDAKRGAS